MPAPSDSRRSQANGSSAAPSIRCAIHTRKSTEEGLEQDFNTLDAQREAAQSFIASQRSEGWTLTPARYDDGGYTGAHMDRPALQRLLADIRSGQVNCVVVYKVDRLTRSLLDFSRIMEVLDRNGATFVSVTTSDVPPSDFTTKDQRCSSGDCFFVAVNLLSTKNNTAGCGPSDFCPTVNVTFDQMASSW